MPRMPPHVQRYVVEQMRGDLSGGAVARQRVGAYGDNTRVMDGLLSRNPKISGRLSVAIRSFIRKTQALSNPAPIARYQTPHLIQNCHSY